MGNMVTMMAATSWTLYAVMMGAAWSSMKEVAEHLPLACAHGLFWARGRAGALEAAPLASTCFMFISTTSR
ncbi:hypothetical protein COO60DRAFT_1492540 [Scenedesmus sp. NREL 46B-D3]|nr:hypothetical protein COO60DRAFT_1492540 [Scenedesmus sp. NREL 46B-D3]